MKRKLSLFLTAIMVLSAMTVGLFNFTAVATGATAETVSESNSVCDGVHHTYNNKNIASQYKKSDATCVARAIYYYSCSCGEKGEETFTSGSPLGHSYNTAVVENLPNEDTFGNTYQICSRCSYKNVQPLVSCSTCEGDGKVLGTVDCPNCNNGYPACSWCGGTGKEETSGYYDNCWKCEGDGDWYGTTCSRCYGKGYLYYLYDCFECDGTGESKYKDCQTCDGLARISAQVDCTHCSGKGYYKHIEIKFNFLGGSNGPKTQISSNDKLTISTQKPTKKGYIFVGWNTLENDQTIYQPGDTYTGDSTTFFAIWVPACSECGGRGCFISYSTCTTCGGDGTYQKDTYKCRDCGTTNKINHVVGQGRKCGNCGSWDVSYVGTYTIDCGCENGQIQNSTNCTACSATGRGKVVAPTLVSKTSNQIVLLLVEGMEYSRNGTTWQSSNVFTGLSPATTYTFYQRIANNGTIPFGATSEDLTVITACASEEAHNKNSKCVCTICGIESHSLNEKCICTACGEEKHILDKNCICINCRTENHSLDAKCICTKCGAAKHNLSAYCVCLECGATFHKFESDTCIVCHNSKTDWDGSVATSFESGSGTSTDPYIISTGSQLAYLASQVNAGTTYKDCYFELSNDINLRGIDWNPIGNGYNNYYFGGIFDGKGCVIDNLTITKSYKCVGLFGLVGRAKISNIGVENININSTYSSSMSAVGGLVGFAQESTISNCYTKGTVYGANNSSGSSAMVGGLIGRLYGSSSIVNSYSNITVSGTSKGWNTYVGGLIGYLECQDAADIITIANCYTVSTVRSVTYKSNQWAEAGGLIGIVDGYGMVNISKCFAECNVSGAGTYIKIDSFLALNITTLPAFRDCYYVCYSTGCNYSGVFVSTTENFKSQTWLTDTLGWDFSNTWKIDSNQYPTLKAFVRCNHSNTKEDTTYLKSAATCTSPAFYYKSCVDCGKKLDETFEYGTALGHDYESKWTTDVHPTCTTSGSKSHHCTRCGDKSAVTNIPSSGHSYGNWHVVTAPSCTEAGTEEHKCSVCQHTETRTVKALGHAEGEWIIDKEATCTEDGSKHKACLTCGETVYDTIAKLGHIESDWIIEKEVSCTEAGSRHKNCTVCGITLIGESIGPKGHTDGEWIIDKEATTAEEGSKHQVCSVCGETIKTEVIPKQELITGECGENVTWSLDLSTGVLTISGSGAMNDYSSYGPWYSYEKSIKKAVIENGVTSIGNRAFYDCPTLKEITISDSVTSISRYAFYGCGSLTRIDITDISAWCNISFASDISNPLYYAKKLYLNGILVTELTIPDGVTSIGSSAFAYCKSLTSITIPDSVTSIGSYAFEYCTNITNINIPVSVTSIGKIAFYGCTGITSIYYNAANLSDLSSDNYIFGDAGQSGDGIKVTIGKNVQHIPAWLFFPSYYSDDPKITELTFEEGSVCESIGNNAFYGCESLTRIDITDISAWCNINFDSYYSNPLYYAKKLYLNGILVTELTIPDGVTSIGSSAFSGCTSIKNINVPESVTSIGDFAFFSCTSLVSISIPDSVTSIGNNAFRKCTSLVSINIPDSVTNIGGSALYDCTSLVSVTFCSRTTEISDSNYTISATATIYGYSGSTAARYAAKYGRTFVALQCDHSFTKEDATYLASGATCMSPAIYYKSCEHCGEKGTETFEVGEALGHTGGTATCTAKAECTRCHQPYGNMLNHVYTEQDATAAYLKSAATCTSKAVYYKNCATCDKAGTATFEYGNFKAHSYIEKVEDAYLKASATCTSKAVYYKSCSACGVKGTETFEVGDAPSHNYQTTWSSDATSHWHECSKCGDKKDNTSHTAGAAATESTAQTCTVCGYVITPALGHTHNYNTTWSNNATEHWHDCVGCSSTKDNAPHDYTNACDTNCNTCGYVRTITHSYKTEWSSNEEKHWYECSVCGDKSSEANHIPGTEATETTDQICTVCGYVIEQALDHIHDHSTIKNDETNHWNECVCGDKSNIATHTWDTGVVTKEATYDVEGERTFTCSVCSKTKTESIEKLIREDDTTTTPDINTNVPGNSDSDDAAPKNPTNGYDSVIIIVAVSIVAIAIICGVAIFMKKKQS